MFVGVGDNAHLKRVGGGATNGKADAIDRDASLVNGEVAVPHHLLRTLVTEGVLVAALLVLDIDTSGGLVDVALHDVPVQAAVHLHGALHVDLIAHAKQAEVAAFERLAHGGDGIGVSFFAHHGEADAVVSHTLVDAEFLGKRATEGEVDVVLVVFDSHYSRHRFYYSGKHKRI